MLARAVFVFTFIAATANFVWAQSPQSATSIAVTLPVDAELTVNGRATSTTGQVRQFRDSQAVVGNVYRYELRATIERDGQRFSQVRNVRLPAGAMTEVAFQFPEVNLALKTTTGGSGELVAQASAYQSRFQAQPGPATDDSALPPLGERTGDQFQPRTPDLGVPTPEPAQESPPARQFELPPLDEPADSGRFGRQFGEERQPPVTPSDGNLAPPTEPAAPMRADKAQGGPAKNVAPPPAAPANPRPAAYIGHGHQHHLLGETGTVLHVWHHRWRMANLQRSTSTAKPYVLYDEVGHDGFTWAYGLQPFWCDRFPVFFKPGANARWCFIGYAKRVQPFTN